VKTMTTDGKGLHGLTAKKLKAGRYRIEVRATDIAGNRSSLKRLTLRVR